MYLSDATAWVYAADAASPTPDYTIVSSAEATKQIHFKAKKLKKMWFFLWVEAAFPQRLQFRASWECVVRGLRKG